jgi:hypothetical protein
MSIESKKPSTFESVIAAFTMVVAFTLGYGYWRLSNRLEESEARIEARREQFERAALQLQIDAEARRAADAFEIQVISLVAPHLGRLRDSGRAGATSQRIVEAAADLLSARGRPALSQMTKWVLDEEDAAAPAVTNAWLVVLATLPGNDLKTAEALANDKLRAAKDLGLAPAVSIYKTKLKGRYVVALGEPLRRSAAVAIASEARRRNLAADAFAEPDGGWDLAGTAPFSLDMRSASAE